MMADRSNNDIFSDTSLSLGQQIAESAANAKAAGIPALTPQSVVNLQRSLGVIPQSALQAKAAGTPVSNTQLASLATSTPAANSTPGTTPVPTVSGTSTLAQPSPATPTAVPSNPVTAALDPSRAALSTAAAPQPTPATPASQVPAPSLTPQAGQLTGAQINALTAQANSVSHNADANLIAQGPAAVQALIDKLQAEGAAGTRNPSNVAASVAHLQAMLALGGPTGRTKAQIFADPTTTNAQKLAEMSLNATGPSAAAAAGVDPLTALRAAQGTSGASQTVLNLIAAAGLPVATTQDNSNPFTGANAPAGGVLNPPNAAVTTTTLPATGDVRQGQSTPASNAVPIPFNGAVKQGTGLPGNQQEIDQRPLAQGITNRGPVQDGHTILSNDDLQQLLGIANTPPPAADTTVPASPAASPPAAGAASVPILPPIVSHPLSSLVQNTLNGVQLPTVNPFTGGVTSASLGRDPVEDDLASLLNQIRTGTTAAPIPSTSNLVRAGAAPNIFNTFN